MRSLIFSLLLPLAVSLQCSTDLDCSLNGVCTAGACHCDAGWTASNCGALDIKPGPRANGYNYTSNGISSWGSKIIRDPSGNGLWHSFIAEFANGCGLDQWTPYSQVIRATSSTGPLGPFTKQQLIVSTFAHNPTVTWDQQRKQYLLYHIGCPQAVAASGCNTYQFQCSPGDTIWGESGVSLLTSKNLVHWKAHGIVFPGLSGDQFDADTTNPSVFALQDNPYNAEGSHRCPGSSKPNTTATGVLMAYRGSPYDQSGIEQITLASALNPAGPFTRLNNNTAIFTAQAEDPFVWRDKRGNFHIIMHALEPGYRGAPNVGRHAYSQTIDGPWYYDSTTPAFNTTAQFNDGSSIDYFRRERPQLVFTDDGNVTPIVLTTGVQENGSPQSYSLAVPIGDYSNLYNTTQCM